MGFIIFRNDQSTRRIFIEPMNYTWTNLATNTGKVATLSQECIHKRPIGMACCWVNHEAAWLIYHD